MLLQDFLRQHFPGTIDEILERQLLEDWGYESPVVVAASQAYREGMSSDALNLVAKGEIGSIDGALVSAAARSYADIGWHALDIVDFQRTRDGAKPDYVSLKQKAAAKLTDQPPMTYADSGGDILASLPGAQFNPLDLFPSIANTMGHLVGSPEKAKKLTKRGVNKAQWRQLESGLQVRSAEVYVGHNAYLQLLEKDPTGFLLVDAIACALAREAKREVKISPYETELFGTEESARALREWAERECPSKLEGSLTTPLADIKRLGIDMGVARYKQLYGFLSSGLILKPF